MSDVIISVKDLVAGYGAETVLHDVSVDIPRGAFVPFVGPNGAGKTTLLRVILGLLRPRSGAVVTPFASRRAGYVPQQKSIDPLFPVTVEDIVAMGLYPTLGPWRRPSREDHRAVGDALEYVGLADAADKSFAELSGGMKQKALIARALAGDAEVFVMDEPTSELDEQSEREVLAHLHELSRDRGKTVLLAHHGFSRISRLATFFCRIEHGRASCIKADDAESGLALGGGQ